jgi:hypothetical protein
MLPDNRTKRQKNIHRMPERCRNLIPVSKGNRGNKKRVIKKINGDQKIPNSLSSKVNLF